MNERDAGITVKMQGAPRVKGRVYTMVVRPSMTNSLEMMELIKRQETEMV